MLAQMAGFRSLLRRNNIPLHVLHILNVHLSVHGHLGYFHVLVIINSAAMNTEVQHCLPEPDCNSFGYTPRGEIVEL